MAVIRPQNASIELIIEDQGVAKNNSLAGYLACPNSYKERHGKTDSNIWIDKYLNDGVWTKEYAPYTQGSRLIARPTCSN